MRFSLEKINYLLIVSAITMLSIGWVITVLIGTKFHYAYFFLITTILFGLNFSKKMGASVLIYCFLFLVIFCYHLFLSGPNPILLLSASTYFVIPFVYSKNLIGFNDFLKILKALSIISIFNFIGVVLQLLGIGVGMEVLKLDMAMTEGVFHPRYTGFTGGSLALGVLSCTTLIGALYQLIILKNRFLFYGIVTASSLFCLLFSFSRRFYVFGLIGIGVILYVWLKRRRLTVNTYLFILSGVVFSFLVIIVLIFKSETIAERLSSIINFSTDMANIGRLNRWQHALNLFKENFIMGLSPGITGTVGRENITNETVFSAESYYLKILLETGVLVSFSYFTLLFYMLKKSFTSLPNTSLTVPISFFIFYFCESFISTSLESPLSATLFWISISLIYHRAGNVGIANLQKQ